jgi:hypothetical protein
MTNDYLPIELTIRAVLEMEFTTETRRALSFTEKKRKYTIKGLIPIPSALCYTPFFSVRLRALRVSVVNFILP